MKLIRLLKQKLRNPIRSKLLYFFHRKNLKLNKKEDRKTIIMCFDGFSQHGGLLDRLKGIISFYEISKLIGADFKILHTSPYPLYEFLKPNKYNWTPNKSDTEWSLSDTCFFYSMLEVDRNPLEVIRKSKKKKFFVYNNMDYFHMIYSELSEFERKQKWSESFNELFTKSEYLQNLLEDIEIPKDRVAIHTRFTSSLGDFEDTDVPVLGEVEKRKVIGDVTSAIDQVVKDYNLENVYIFSDSITFLNHIKENTDYNLIKGKPLHLDNSNTNKLDLSLYAKTFIDFFIISESSEIFLVVKPKPIMYPSQYSKYASYLYNKPFVQINIP